MGAPGCPKCTGERDLTEAQLKATRSSHTSRWHDVIQDGLTLRPAAAAPSVPREKRTLSYARFTLSADPGSHPNPAKASFVVDNVASMRVWEEGLREAPLRVKRGGPGVRR